MADEESRWTPPSLAQSGAAGEWVASRYADATLILSDGRFGVPEAGPPGEVGTISWLRASVSRFANGAEHDRRRACTVAELAGLEPDGLRRAAHRRARAVIASATTPGGRLDVMARLARAVPMTVLAAGLGIEPAEAAAHAVTDVAAAYLGAAPAAVAQAADAATAWLVDRLNPGSPDVIVARIGLMAQGCEATAGLIGIALHLLQDTPEASAWPAGEVLGEVVRHRPVVRASRRVATAPVSADGAEIAAGDVVICDVEAANRDPAGKHLPVLTFGYGVRPCPGQPQALALAAGVVDAVRESCSFLPGQPVEYQPSSPLRIPVKLEVVRR